MFQALFQTYSAAPVFNYKCFRLLSQHRPFHCSGLITAGGIAHSVPFREPAALLSRMFHGLQPDFLHKEGGRLTACGVPSIDPVTEAKSAHAVTGQRRKFPDTVIPLVIL